jgi:hypothetical protein
MAFTEFVRWGNGSDKPESGYHKSLLKGKWSAQQFAAALGVNQGSARDIMSGRRTGSPLGEQINGTWFILINIALEYLEKQQANQ